MLSSGANVTSGSKCYHLGRNVFIWDAMLSSGANVFIWEKMLSSGMKCYHLELMLSYGTNCYHLGWNVIILDAMLSSGANVIIWCYHVMLSSGMITPPFFVFPGNFTHSPQSQSGFNQRYFFQCSLKSDIFYWCRSSLEGVFQFTYQYR